MHMNMVCSNSTLLPADAKFRDQDLIIFDKNVVLILCLFMYLFPD